ncbi:MAG: DUF2628 domain-containing protein [Pseudomonadaceae bacterium]|nr:DUF2628 domain-containing protein [Pseudomonadaceae bacterium]
MTDDDQALFAAAIGTRNTGYYMNYFERADNRGYAPISWNWPVLFFGLFWLLYRRQYTWAGISVLFSMSLGLLAGGIAGAGYEQIGNWLYSAGLIAFLGVYLPLHANGIYYRWCRTIVDTAKQQLPGQREHQLDRLATMGGPNRPLLLAMVIILLLTMSLGGPLQQLATQGAG